MNNVEDRANTPGLDPEAINAIIDKRKGKAVQRLEKRRTKAAGRIARRAIKHIEKGDMPVVVKGGPLGIRRTQHDAATYAKVGRHLSAHGVEAAVKSVSEVGASDAPSIMPPYWPLEDVIIPHTISGKPIDVTGPIQPAGLVPSIKVEQIHPPIEKTPQQ